MSLPLNYLLLSGWVLSGPNKNPYAHRSGCLFELLYHPYHEAFHHAKKDPDNALIIPVVALLGDTDTDCKAYLAKGDRVTVYGQLRSHGYDGMVLHAHQVERSELLESLRYVNHAWHGLRQLRGADTQETTQEEICL